MTLDVATTAIDADGFALGSVTSDPAGTDPIPSTWLITMQDPAAGTKKPAGFAINLVFADPATAGCP